MRELPPTLVARPQVLRGYTRNIVAPEGTVHITINSDDQGPLEVFITVGKAGSDLMAMAPFGLANPKPVFSASGIDVVDGPRRLKERHLKMSLRQKGRTFRAIAWNAVEKEPVLAGGAGALEVAYALEQNEFNGNTYTELRLSDVRRA